MAKLFGRPKVRSTPCRDARELSKKLAVQIISVESGYALVREAIYGIRPTKRALYVALCVYALVAKARPDKATLFLEAMYFAQKKVKP